MDRLGRIFSIDSMSGQIVTFHQPEVFKYDKTNHRFGSSQLMISHDLIGRVGKQHVKKNQFTRNPPQKNLMKKHLILASLEPLSFSRATGHVSFKTSAAISQASGFSNGRLPVGHSAPQTRWV